MIARIRVGVVGIGVGRQVHVPAFRADARCEVVAICAADAARAATAAAALGIKHSTGDWRSLAASSAIDVLSIAVPPALQPKIIEAACMNGKHVFCEKPVGATLEDARAALTSAEKAGVRHAVDFLFTRVPAWMRAKKTIEDGALGAIRHATLSWKVETLGHREKNSASWKMRAADGGGTLSNFASHSLHDLEWLFGRIARVQARLFPATGTDALVDAWLETQAGVPITVTIAANAPLGSGHRLEVYGETQTIVIENRGPDYARDFAIACAVRGDKSLSPTPQVAAGPADVDGRIAPAASLASSFLDTIVGGATISAQPAPDLREGVRVQELIAAMHAAHESGTWTQT